VDQLQAIEADPLSPIFPTGGGEPATKIGWADTFQAIAAVLGIPLHHPNGARIFTGHSARVTGARHLASTNVELWRIQLFGRWGSSVFLHYIRTQRPDADISIGVLSIFINSTSTGTIRVPAEANRRYQTTSGTSTSRHGTRLRSSFR